MQRSRLPQQPACESEKKIQIFVVCEESGKKYRLMFKESVFGIVTVFHIRQQLKRLLSDHDFELYFKGQLLSDSVFCKSSQIVSGSTILLKRTKMQSTGLQYKNFQPKEAEKQLETYEKHFETQGDTPVLE